MFPLTGRYDTVVQYRGLLLKKAKIAKNHARSVPPITGYATRSIGYGMKSEDQGALATNAVREEGKNNRRAHARHELLRLIDRRRLMGDPIIRYDAFRFFVSNSEAYKII